MQAPRPRLRRRPRRRPRSRRRRRRHLRRCSTRSRTREHVRIVGYPREVTPYRSGRALGAPDAAPEAGLVDEMVRQFADPYAFLRELAQNGIDAGATRIAVTIERDGD